MLANESVPAGAPEDTAMAENAPSVAGSAIATKFIIALNVVVFCLMAFTTGPLTFVMPSPETLLAWGANLGMLTAQGETWRLITSNYIHVGVLHLGLNMYFFWTAGQMVERCFGTVKFMIIYLLSGFVASLATISWNPTVISAGASGAIYGVVGALLAFLWGRRAHVPAKQLRYQLTVMVVFVLYSLFLGSIFPRVDKAAHVGGLIAGLLAGLCLVPRLPGDSSWSRKNILAVVALVCITAAVTPLVMTRAVSDPQTLAYQAKDRARHFIKTESYEQALEAYNELVRVDPNSSAAYSGRALAFIGLKQYQQAIDDCDRAIKLDHFDASAYLTRATARHYLGSDRDAIEDLTKVLKINPKNAMAFNSRAWSLIAIGKYEEGLGDANKAIELNPKISAAHDTRGVAYLYTDDPQKAVDDFTSALALNPNEGAAYYHRAQAWKKLGQTEKSDADAKRAVELKYVPERWESHL